MNNEIDVVEETPFSFLCTFDMQRSRSEFPESFIDTFGDCLIVAAGGPGADDEMVGERTNLVEVEDHDVLRLLVEGGFERFGQMIVSCFFGNGFYLTNKVCVC